MNEFVVITGIGADDFNSTQIKVLKTDGTTAVVGFEEKTDYIPAEDSEDGKTLGIKSYKGALVIMKDADADGKCEFKAVEGTQDGNGDKKYDGFDAAAVAGTKVALDSKDDILDNGWKIADDAVVFTVNGKGEYKVTTGAKLAAADKADVINAYANKDDSGFYTAQLVFVTTEMSSSSDVVYGYITEKPASVKNADDEQVFEITFWNGEKTVTMLTSDNGEAAKALAKGSFFSYKLNQDGEISSINEKDFTLTAGAISAFDGKKITFVNDATKYDVDEDTIIFYVDVEDVVGAEDGAISLADENEADGKDGAEDTTKTTYFNNVMYVVDKEGDVLVLIADVQNRMGTTVEVKSAE